MNIEQFPASWAIRIALQGQPGAYTGTVTDGTDHWNIATWARGGDDGHVNATTTDGERVTLATEDGGDEITGGITIGNTLAARIWSIRDGVRDTAARTLTGTAYEVPSDQWLADYVERMAARVRG